MLLLVLFVCEGVGGVWLGWGWDTLAHPFATTLRLRVHLFTKVTIIKSRLRIATYLYFSIFVASLSLSLSLSSNQNPVYSL